MAGPSVQNSTTGSRQPSRESSTSSGNKFGRSMENANGQHDGSKPGASGKDGGKKGPSFMDVVHGGLDAAGLWPGVGIIPDLLNAGLYGIRGEGKNAMWSLGSAIPVAGQAVTGPKWAKKGVDAADALSDGVRASSNANDASRVLSKTGDDASSQTAAGVRPSWRQSETDVGTRLEGQGYRPQVSYKDGQEVTYGTKGSVRPEYSKPGNSIEVKNYNVETSQGRSNLVRNITKQVSDRAKNLPAGSRQEIIIDVRGQNASRAELNNVIDRIVEKSNGAVQRNDIHILR